MKIKKNKKPDVAYIQFRKGTVSKTVKLSDDLLVDYDKEVVLTPVEI